MDEEQFIRIVIGACVVIGLMLMVWWFNER